MKLHILVGFIVCYLATLASGQVVHTTTTFLNPPREAPVACYTSGLFFVAGGVSDLPLVDVLNAHTGVWTTASLSAPRSNLAAAGTSSLCLFGGGTFGGANGNVVDIFNASSGKFSNTTLSAPRMSLAAASNGEVVSFAGGVVPFISAFTPSAVVDIYTVSTNTWSVASLSQARGFLAGASTAHTLIFAGGTAVGGDVTTVDLYHTLTKTWTTANLSSTGTGAGASSRYLAFFPLENGNIDVYDERTGKWSTLPAPQPGLAFFTAAANELFAVFSASGGNVASVYNITTGKFSNSTVTYPSQQESTSASNATAAIVTDFTPGVDVYSTRPPSPSLPPTAPPFPSTGSNPSTNSGSNFNPTFPPLTPTSTTTAPPPTTAAPTNPPPTTKSPTTEPPSPSPTVTRTPPPTKPHWTPDDKHHSDAASLSAIVALVVAVCAAALIAL